MSIEFKGHTPTIYKHHGNGELSDRLADYARQQREKEEAKRIKRLKGKNNAK